MIKISYEYHVSFLHPIDFLSFSYYNVLMTLTILPSNPMRFFQSHWENTAITKPTGLMFILSWINDRVDDCVKSVLRACVSVYQSTITYIPKKLVTKYSIVTPSRKLMASLLNTDDTKNSNERHCVVPWTPYTPKTGENRSIGGISNPPMKPLYHPVHPKNNPGKNRGYHGFSHGLRYI